MKRETLIALSAGMAISIAGVSLAHADETTAQTGNQQTVIAAPQNNQATANGMQNKSQNQKKGNTQTTQ